MQPMIGRRGFLAGAGAASLGCAFAGCARSQPSVGSISPAEFGATGDGNTNDEAALERCFAHAAARRLSVDGGTRTFGCSESLWFEGLPFVAIRSLSLKQLNPENGRCCLGFEGTDSIEVGHVRIQTGSAAAVGDMDSTRGFHVRGGKGHRISNVEVTGSGKMTFIRFEECVDSVFSNLHVHDCQFDDPKATDDVVQGIHIYRTRGCRVIAPRVSNLTGNASYIDRTLKPRRYANLRTRGLAIAGNQDLVIDTPEIANTDQAIDVSGSDGNRRLSIHGGHSVDCGSVGVKLANSAVDCTVTGHQVRRSGMWGFLASGPSEAGLPFKTSNCSFVDCEAYDVGYNEIQNDLDSVGENIQVSSGFGVVLGDYDRSYPSGIRFIRCRAEDQQGLELTETVPAGATRATLKLPFRGRSGSHVARFGSQERAVVLTDGSSAVHWSEGLRNPAPSAFMALPTMVYGFFNEVPAPGGPGQANLLESCGSAGHIEAFERGFDR
jgi:hypothetical protein